MGTEQQLKKAWTESERRGERLPLAALSVSKASQLTEL